ncbi:hypothetical protein VNO77_44326 [Canavalia gladiata]|uniref:Uncharacterized protein n=1 Tax=Canavalia gladiata TaxID=3824 RepID=A0AAN9JY09_CANGL
MISLAILVVNDILIFHGLGNKAQRHHKWHKDLAGPESDLVNPRHKQKIALLQLLKLGKMLNWGPVVVSVVLFALLTPGLLFQLPGRSRCVEFGNFQTSAAAILVHSLLYFALVCLFFIAIKVHFYLG